MNEKPERNKSFLRGFFKPAPPGLAQSPDSATLPEQDCLSPIALVEPPGTDAPEPVVPQSDVPQSDVKVEVNKMENIFHNRSLVQIAEMAFEAQQRMQTAKAELDACKIKLIEIAQGAELRINVPQRCRVTVEEAGKNADKKDYAVNSKLFEALDFETRQRLEANEIIKERSRDEPKLPTVRISAL